MSYFELAAISNFSFLRGGSHPDELVLRAAALGLSGLGLCDRNSLAGVVRAHVAARDLKQIHPDFRFVAGTRLVFSDGTPDILAYPTDRAAYGRLCALLTRGNRRAEKGDCILMLDDLCAFAQGQLLVAMPDEADPQTLLATLCALKPIAGDGLWLAANCLYQGGDRARLSRLADLARQAGVSLLAVNDVLYHAPERRPLQDAITCIREHLTIFQAGRRLEKNAERHLKPPQEMARLFREHRQAIAQTQVLVSRIAFSLDDLRYEYPEETIGNGETAQQTLERLTWAGAKRRYPQGVPERVVTGIRHELALIGELKYAPYFLTVHDLVRFAREERGILCQGRGSAANSAVCFCLGVTEVDPMLVDLLFERFISTERNEPPDIDVDFEHERREEVIQYIYQRYGRERAGLAATVVTYRTKGAVREIGKVFGLSADMIEALNGLSWGWHDKGVKEDRIRELGIDPTDHTLSLVLKLVRELIGFPRHLSQHVGGFVITRGRLDHLVPISNAAMQDRTVVEWDKDDLDALGILKVDVLALGMLTCIRRAFDLLALHYGERLTLASVPQYDTPTYRMIQRADTVGVFQIESRAQMSMLPRLKPETFYDLVIEVAIVRPGPIQGDMVHPYLRRRQGKETVTYPSKDLERVLSKTLGVPLFQEQAMKIAIVAGGFTPSEADRLRRAMATFRRNGTIGNFRQKMISGMLERGYTKDFAERCFSQIEGFGEYGFPESHAASFALLVYVSAWLKCHYPDVFAAALLNSQPMGFYAPAQIVRDAREHGVEVRDVDINLSDAENALEPGPEAATRLWARHIEMHADIHSDKAVRLGLSRIKGLKADDAALIVARRGRGYDSVRDVWLRTGLGPAVLARLAEADAFRSIGLDRRAALWAVRGLMGTDGAETLPLFAGSGPPSARDEPDADLPPMPPGEQVIHDYRSLSLSLKAHPVSFLREELGRRRILAADELRHQRDGAPVEVAGLVLVRQRPGTASGVIFATLEDETGVANVIVWPRVFEANRRVVLGSRLLSVKGVLQKEGLVIHVVARQLTDMTPDLLRLADGGDLGAGALARADEGRQTHRNPVLAKAEAAQTEAARRARAALPKGRNFH
ncbi:MAG TPA: error-prone DNA polymerase [Devosiaceae bacterium]